MLLATIIMYEHVLGMHNKTSLFVMIGCTFEVINLNSFVDIGLNVLMVLKILGMICIILSPKND